MDIQLRPHQSLAIDMIKQSLSTNKVNSKKRIKRVLVAGCCSFGKTILAAQIMKSAAANGKRPMLIADRIKLIDQTAKTFDKYGMDYGVIQAMHPKTAPWKPIQIASVNTLQGMPNLPDADFFIIDEAHNQSAYVKTLMEKYDNCIFLGLSASPYSKGLGKMYDDMVVPATVAQLLEQGYLCPIKYFAGHKVDISHVRTAGGKFNQEDLEHAIDKDKVITGSIIDNWKKHANGENFQTIAFSPSIAHSKGLCEMFNDNGISAEHIDAFTTQDDRDALYEAHDRGEFQVLSCSQLLSTGYDAAGVRCVVDIYPTKSLITYVQRVGRIQRIAEGKEFAVLLDHAGNTERFGFIESIIPSSLCDGEKKDYDTPLTKERKETEAELKPCPRCYQSFTGFKCQCGFEVSMTKRLADDGTELVELKPSKPLSKMTAAEKRAFQHSKVMKEQFQAELMKYARVHDKQYGWVSGKFREYYGESVNRHVTYVADAISKSTDSWIRASNIKYHKGRARA